MFCHTTSRREQVSRGSDISPRLSESHAQSISWQETCSGPSFCSRIHQRDLDMSSQHNVFDVPQGALCYASTIPCCELSPDAEASADSDGLVAC